MVLPAGHICTGTGITQLPISVSVISLEDALREKTASTQLMTARKHALKQMYASCHRRKDLVTKTCQDGSSTLHPISVRVSTTGAVMEMRIISETIRLAQKDVFLQIATV
jgi:hypothetical protein